MEINYNPTKLRNASLIMLLHEEVGLWLTSPTNTFVVFNGKAEIEFQGTLAECYIYNKFYKRNKGFECTIYSIEAYNELITTLKKQFN